MASSTVLCRLLAGSLVFATACSAAHAEQPYTGSRQSARIALGIAPPRIRAPYDVQIMRDSGETLPTYQLRDRFYVQGSVGERYVIRITNPTHRRIEAVVSVDGLDVIDGENGDLRKRGYVVPAYGETRIEGFRTSQADVATFRFSSVGGSYAGQKGKARNVGVIAVALFEEVAPPEEQQIIIGQSTPPPPHYRRPYGSSRDLDGRAAPSAEESVADRAPGKSTSANAGSSRGSGGELSEKRAAEAPPAARPVPSSGGADRFMPSDDHGDYEDEVAMPEPRRPSRERLGLGTEFGEQRYSAASYTRFVRAAGRPVAIAELRYNDTAGLMALGIPVAPLPDSGEIMMRETADPFPGDRFARPVR